MIPPGPTLSEPQAQARGQDANAGTEQTVAIAQDSEGGTPERTKP